MHHKDLMEIRAVGRMNTMNLSLSSLGRGEMRDPKISQQYWPRVNHVSWWMKVEVRYFHQYRRVFRLSFISVGRIFYGDDPSKDFANPVVTPPLPLTNQDQQELPPQEPPSDADHRRSGDQQGGRVDPNKLQNELAQHRVYGHLGGARESRISLQSARSGRSLLRRNMRGKGSCEFSAYSTTFISAEITTGVSLNHGSDGSIRSRRSSIRETGEGAIHMIKRCDRPDLEKLP
jgi:hypothetical protein